ncbi:hypothetical protein V8B55DRAFT_1320260 [Mucor lusitanicus]|uniref:Uncharacterized protein n=1 Tax=Mucor lusitanicus CBS 277.49 TaxID=747725 RepID=A0A168JKA6_MUCCL|nr:hypothetical protein MUCCIDRAFT_165194 [Mucor lusitanicus CBS 277.49]
MLDLRIFLYYLLLHADCSFIINATKKNAEHLNLRARVYLKRLRRLIVVNVSLSRNLECSQNNLDPHFIQARDNHRVDIDLHNQAEKATVVIEVAAAVGVVIAPRQRPARRPTPPRETENMAPIPAFEQQEFATGYYHWFRQSADSLFEFNIDAQHPPQMEVLMMDQNQRFAEEAFEEVQNRGPMNAEAWIFNEEQQSRLFVQRNMHQLTLLRKLPPIDLTDDRIRNAMGRQQQDPR